MIFRARIHTAKESGNLHLRVWVPQYSDELSARLHRIGSPARFDFPTNEFDYPLTAAAVSTLQKLADELGATIDWSSDLVEFATQQKNLDSYESQVRLAIERLIRSSDPIPEYPTITQLPNGKPAPPMRHQQIAYQWALRSSAIYLAWDPGTGKTRAGSDSLGGWYREKIIRPMEQVWLPDRGRWGIRGGALIVSPKQMMRTWRDELKQWQGATGIEISGGRAEKARKAGMIAHAHLINYESLRNVEGNQYDAIIYDEAHRLAHHTAQTTKSLALAQVARRRMGLSGTPVSNSLESVFYQMLVLDGGKALGASRPAFLEEFFDVVSTGPGGSKYEPKAGALEKISAAMSRCTYFLKKEEALDLPPRTHTPLYLEMTPDQKRYYEQLKQETLVFIQDSAVTVDQVAARMMKLRQTTQGFILDDEGNAKTFSHSKIEVLCDILINKLPGQKVVIWGVFTHEIEMLCRKMHELQIGYVRFDGTVTSKKVRDEALWHWNNTPQVTAFIGQIQMGVGITLTANECTVPCHHCIYMGVDYSYVNWKQSVDRIHRIGQIYPCHYTYLLTEDGIDSNIYKALQMKEGTANAVHKKGKDFFLSLLKGDENLAALDGAA